MKLRESSDVIVVDGSVERRMGRAVRPDGEITMISDLACDLCGGDEAEAEKLIHRVLFEMHGRTWGVSLREGDPDQPLVTTRMICEYLRLAIENQEALDPLKLTKRAVALAAKRPHEISLYRSMVFELCRVEDVRTFERALAMRGGRLVRMCSEDVQIYQRIVGKSYWELDLDMLRRVFISNFLAWKVGMAKLEKLEEEEVQQPEFLAEVSSFLTGLRFDLRRIARVVVAKNVLPERELTKPRRIEIDTEKIKKIQLMMGEAEEADSDDEQIDMRIDMETARQFLD